MSDLAEVEHQQLEALGKLEHLADELSSGPLLTQADIQRPKLIS